MVQLQANTNSFFTILHSEFESTLSSHEVSMGLSASAFMLLVIQFQNDCIATKLHYSLRVLYGADYISNDTDTNLETILQYIPEDIAMMLPTDELAKVPSTSCMQLMTNIGKARLNLLPLAGAGLERRKALANITMSCIVSISSIRLYRL